MVTMREAVDAYEQRYFSGKGKELADRTNVILSKNDLSFHDMFHIMASGVIPMISGDLVGGFRRLEDVGAVDNIVGIKSEFLEAIYLKVFIRLDGFEKISFNEIKASIYNDAFKTVINSINKQLQEIENSQSDNNGIKYSNIHAVNNLFDSYNNHREVVDLLGVKTKKFCEYISINTFISDEEIESHIKSAEKLYNKLKNTHPECFLTGMDEEKLLDLDIKCFQVDNFTATEKEKLQKNKVITRFT